MKKLKYIILAIIGIACGWGLILLIDGRVRHHEVLECQRWQQQAIDYAEVGYYLTEWQRRQCEALGVPIKLAEPILRNYNY